MEQAGLTMTPGGFLLASVVMGALVSFIAGKTVHLLFMWALGAVIGAALPALWVFYKRRARLKKFEEQFPEALDLLARALRAGHALQAALGMVAEELHAPVGLEFKKTFEQQNFGLPLNEALNDLAVRVPLMDVRFFATAIAIQRDTGGNLAEILDNLANVVRERFKIIRQVRVHTAHGRFTGYVLLALPAVLAMALSFINPGHMNLLFQEHMGRVMLAATVVMQTVGYFWIKKVIKIEV
jgi:tight adherence protein B